MEQLQELQTQFGLMTWPLIICSALTVMIIAERLFQVFISLGVGKSAIRQHLASLDPTNSRDIEALADELSG
ncbi:TPA: MotA/TolQ/ExbB proton channel family protein, partial [Vibrio parahaemolyticus]